LQRGKGSLELQSYVKRFTSFWRERLKIPRGGWVSPLQAFLRKIAETNRIIYRLCTLDVEKTREDAANKLVEAIGQQYEVLGNKKSKKPEKQKAARLMGYLIQVLTGLLSDVAVDQILQKWKRVEKLAEAEYGKAGQGSGEVARTTPTA
jgi:hypothetical protein